MKKIFCALSLAVCMMSFAGCDGAKEATVIDQSDAAKYRFPADGGDYANASARAASSAGEAEDGGEE